VTITPVKNRNFKSFCIGKLNYISQYLWKGVQSIVSERQQKCCLCFGLWNGHWAGCELYHATAQDPEVFLARLHKVHPAYRVVNAGGRAGVFNRVPTLCNQVFSYLLAYILQTLHNVLCTHWRYAFDFFKVYRLVSKNLHVVEPGHFSSMFCIDSTYFV
jgi:hypothetical protein